MSFAEAFQFFLWAMLATLVVGGVAPLLGGHLLLRRTGLYGLVLPQFASAGVALGYAVLPWWIAVFGLGGRTLDEALADPHAASNVLLGFAALATAVGLAVQAAFARARATESARAVGAFAVAGAATLLLSQLSPMGAEYVDSLLRGEVLAVGVHEFEVLAAGGLVAVLLLLRFQNALLLCGFDPDTARVQGLSLVRHEWVLLGALGLVVATGTLIVGPMVLFSLLVLPPLGARSLSRSQRGFFRWSVALGLASAVAGLVVSLRLDQPLGPAVALAAAALSTAAWALSRRQRALP
ncbi:MAG: hypothetical protein GC161_09450 [Planctomycetaceae bacterium]|nr:hypothetical protein [Planctomycetaceae bacterium]